MIEEGKELSPESRAGLVVERITEDMAGNPLCEIVAGRIRNMIATANPDFRLWPERDFELTGTLSPYVRIFRHKSHGRRAIYEAHVEDLRTGDFFWRFTGTTYAELLKAAFDSLREEIEYRWKWRGVEDQEYNGYSKRITEKPIIHEWEGILIRKGIDQ